MHGTTDEASEARKAEVGGCKGREVYGLDVAEKSTLIEDALGQGRDML